MKIDLRWQLLLAAICLGLVMSLLSYQAQSVGLCTTRVPSAGGRLAVGIVGRPDKINPLLSNGNPVDRELAGLIFDGLLQYGDDGLIEPALADGWEVSDDGLTVTFQLKDNVRWHDGRPFSARDVVFTYGLLQSDAFEAPEPLKQFWKPITISSTDELEVVFTLPQPYSPFLDATTLGILPYHLLGSTSAATIADHSFNRSPVGTGPFAVSQVTDWEQVGQLRLIPNRDHWQRDIQLDTIDYHFYPSSESLAEAFTNGDVQAISGLSMESVPEFLSLPGIRLFSSPAQEMTQLLFNTRETASPVVQVVQGRSALSRGIDRSALIDEAIDGQGILMDGPYLPSSWAFVADSEPKVTYDKDSAALLLDDLGWILVDGGEVRTKEGTRLIIRLLFADENQNPEIAHSLAMMWSELGIETEQISASPPEMREALQSGDFDVALVQIQPPGDPDLYDFWSQEAIINGQNYGGWNHRQASEELETARQIYDVETRSSHYRAFLDYFYESLPALTLFQHVDHFALSDTVKQADIGLVKNPRDRFDSLPDWFMLFREIPVACPEIETNEPIQEG